MNSALKYLLAVLVVSSVYSCTAQTPPAARAQRAIQQFAADPDLANAGISFQAMDLSTGKIIAHHNANLSLAPASTLKLVTTATALEVMGSNFHFSTKLAYDGEMGNEGILNGNLYLIGGGDPCLASRYFPEQKELVKKWAQLIKAHPIRAIKGDIILVNSHFSSELPRTWIWEDIANYYGAIPHGISYRDNTYSIYFQSGTAGTKTKIQKISPKEAGIEFQNQVVSSSLNRDNAYIFGGPESPLRIIKGSIPQNRNNFRVKGAMAYPAKVLGAELKKQLIAEGIRIQGQTKTQNLEESSNLGQVIVNHKSPNLEKIIYYTNQKSVNLFAEHLLLELGRQKYQQGDITSGLKAIKSYWEGKNISFQGIYQYDGSGLSRFNAINASFLTRMLVHMSKSPNQQAFVASLPVAGESGTLKNFGRNTILEHKLSAKTGSMQGVRSYAGYLVNHKNQTIAFTLIVNHYNCTSSSLADKVKQLLFKIYNS